MIIERKKNSIRNFVAKTLNVIVGMILPFLLRTVLIYQLGAKYLGLSSLFTSILSTLNLADLGFSTAIGYSMYKPIAEDDNDTLRALLNLYKKIYRTIGIIVLFVGLCLIPFLDFFVNGECPEDINLVVLYLIYLSNTVISYLFFAYQRPVFGALHRNDIIDNTTSVVQLLGVIMKFFILMIWKNYYAYVIIDPIQTLISNLFIAHLRKKKYPQYYCAGVVNKEITKGIWKNVGALSIHKIGMTISVSLDSLVVSSFLGLTIVGIYSNYSYISNSLAQILWFALAATTAGVGNSIAVETKEKNYDLLMNLTVLNMVVSGTCATCLLCLYQHFISMWVGKDMLLDNSFVVAMVICFYVSTIRKPVILFKDAAGIWWADKWKPLVGGLVNLAINIAVVKTIGILGVTISTVISYLLIEMPWETSALFREYFKSSPVRYVKCIGTGAICTTLSSAFAVFICSNLPSTGWGFFIIKGILCVGISILMFTLAFYKTKEFIYLLGIIKSLFSQIYERHMRSEKK